MGNKTKNPSSSAAKNPSPPAANSQPGAPAAQDSLFLGRDFPGGPPDPSPDLFHPLPGPTCEELSGIVERDHESVDYPEFRSFNFPGLPLAQFAIAYPDDYRGVDPISKDPIEDVAKPDTISPDSILGGELVLNSSKNFDLFLLALQQLCRNYNLDLYKLRQALYSIRIKNIPEVDSLGADGLTMRLVGAFRQSAKRLAGWLARHDPHYNGPSLGMRYFSALAVEFVKINGYIVSIRAGANDVGGPAEEAFSSSSHVSISSMFSSHWP
jgi:hypothetical protein